MPLEEIKRRLKASLPVTPPGAGGSAETFAAVMAIIARANGQPSLGLIRRAGGEDLHSGQISFPGGRIEEGENPLDAAYRETYEETGIAPSSIEVAGFLPLERTIVSGYLVWPVVGVMDTVPEVTICPVEVEEFFWAPLGLFSGVKAPADIRGRPGVFHEDKEIWGFTLRVILSLMEILER